MHYTALDYYKRQALVFIAVTLIVVVSFAFMFWIKQFSIKLFAKYPQVNCDNVLLAHHKEDGTGYQLLQKFAQKEFDDYYNTTGGQEKTPFAGPLQCYCDYSKQKDSQFYELYQQGD